MNVLQKLDSLRKWLQIFGSICAILLVPMGKIMLENTELHVKEAIANTYISKEIFDSERRRLEIGIGNNTENFKEVAFKIESMNMKLDAAIVNQATTQQQIRNLERSIELMNNK